MDLFLIQGVNALVLSMVFFMMSVGLSLVFGQMDFINLCHGSFYLLGAYVGLSVVNAVGNFWLALIVAPLVVGTLAFLLEYIFLRGMYGREQHLEQVLFTFGIAFILEDVMRWYWGPNVHSIDNPSLLEGVVNLGITSFPLYRFSLIPFGIVLFVLAYLFMEKTQLGAIVRAGVSDAQMVTGMGINVVWVFSLVFVVGSGLAAVAGVAGSPILSIYPGLDFEVLIIAFVIIVIGGMGSLKGAFAGSLIVGFVDVFGKAYLPEFSTAILFAAMVLILYVRPRGLFGFKGL